MPQPRIGSDDYYARRKTLLEVIRRGGQTADFALAVDSLALLDGRWLFPDDVSSCSREARASFHEGEDLFAQGRFDDAIPHYEAASALCPGNAVIRTAYADVHYRKGDFEKAREGFHAALALDPWNRAAHRYLSDTEDRLGNRHAAYEEAVLAVVSDPTYELGWYTLRLRMGGGDDMDRSHFFRPADVNGADSSLMMDPTALGDYGDVWMTYALAKLSAPPPHDSSMHARELYGVRAALSQCKATVRADAPGENRSSPGSVWRRLQRAEDAGFLEEAVFVHLMSPWLRDDYVAFRAARRARLIEYVQRIAPLRPLSATGRVPRA
ncbi:MAG TPA: tetratricopeptide repeat protein [Candidatus Limnocylindrales bacterium]|nr:tetratricopeptide repeat protein [Candidatus Limnocylindrales bacterium]